MQAAAVLQDSVLRAPQGLAGAAEVAEAAVVVEAAHLRQVLA